jgi:hypothetical protein
MCRGSSGGCCSGMTEVCGHERGGGWVQTSRGGWSLKCLWQSAAQVSIAWWGSALLLCVMNFCCQIRLLPAQMLERWRWEGSGRTRGPCHRVRLWGPLVGRGRPDVGVARRPLQTEQKIESLVASFKVGQVCIACDARVSLAASAYDVRGARSRIQGPHGDSLTLLLHCGRRQLTSSKRFPRVTVLCL